MSIGRLLGLVVGLILVILFVVGCGGVPVTTPVVEAPAATPTSVPPIATPAPAVGTVKGNLIGAKSQEPLAGEVIMLCLVSAETQCSVQTSLVATVQDNGSFNLSDVSPGQYVVLHGPLEKVETTRKDLDGLIIDYTINASSSMFGDDFFSSFGENGQIEFRSFAVEFKGDPLKPLIKGAIASPKYGLTLEFYEYWKPLTIKVEPDKPTEIEIMASGL